jgi:hypothetical protein
MQTITENGITILKADEGMRLTDGMTIGTTVFLGKEDSGTEWYEITEEEVEQIMTSEDATDEDYQSALREMGVKV